MTPARLRLNHHEQIARAMALVLIVRALDFARFARERLAKFGDQLLARLNKSLASALDGGFTGIKNGCDLCIGQPCGRFQQDARPRNFAGRRFAFTDELEKRVSLIIG